MTRMSGDALNLKAKRARLDERYQRTRAWRDFSAPNFALKSMNGATAAGLRKTTIANRLKKIAVTLPKVTL
jgi:hypothetical protein